MQTSWLKYRLYGGMEQELLYIVIGIVNTSKNWMD